MNLQIGATYIYSGDTPEWRGALMVCIGIKSITGLGLFKAARVPPVLQGQYYVGDSWYFNPYQLRLYKPANSFGLWIRKMEGKNHA